MFFQPNPFRTHPSFSNPILFNPRLSSHPHLPHSNIHSLHSKIQFQHSTTLFHPISSHLNLSHPIPTYPIPTYPIPSQPIPSHPNLSHPIPTYPIPSQPIPSHPNLSHPIPTYPIPTHPIPPPQESKADPTLAQEEDYRTQIFQETTRNQLSHSRRQRTTQVMKLSNSKIIHQQ